MDMAQAECRPDKPATLGAKAMKDLEISVKRLTAVITNVQDRFESVCVQANPTTEGGPPDNMENYPDLFRGIVMLRAYVDTQSDRLTNLLDRCELP